MTHFLRDTHVSNVTINEDTVKEIGAYFEERANSFNAAIPSEEDPAKKIMCYFTIRFDGKGYRIYSLDALLQYFH